MNKILTCAVITVAVFGLCGVLALNTQAKGGNEFYSSIIQKLVERFGLNAEEVQQVFDEARDEKLQEMQARFEERLGDRPHPCGDELTGEQKEALSAKREELREKFKELKDLPLEERQAKTEEIREEMEAWAEENGIDFKCLGGWLRHGFRGAQKGFGWGFGKGFFNPEK